MKKVPLLLIIFSVSFFSAAAFAEQVSCNDSSCTISASSYSAVLRNWYSPAEYNAFGKTIGANDSEGLNYYSQSQYLFFYVLTYPSGTTETLKQSIWDSEKITGQEQIINPYYSPSTRTHYYSQISLPEEKLSFNPTESGRYKIELKQIEIPAIISQKNPANNYNPENVLENWSAEKVTYWLHYPRDSYGTEFYSYSCYYQTGDGKINLFQTYNTRCDQPQKSGSQNCWNTGASQYCLPKETKVYFVNETNICQFPFETQNGWSDYTFYKSCWVEIDQLQKIKVSDLGSKVVWSAEFDAVAPEPEEIGVAAINPFSQSRGSSEKKNSESSNGNNSNSGNVFPVLAAGTAAAAGLVAASSRRGKILITNFKSGFTEFGNSQIQKTKSFFEFLKAEKEGYWVRQWANEFDQRFGKMKNSAGRKAVEEANSILALLKDGSISSEELEQRIESLNKKSAKLIKIKEKEDEEARLAAEREKENAGILEKAKNFIFGYEFPSDGPGASIWKEVNDKVQGTNLTLKAPDGTDFWKVSQKASGKIAEGKSSDEVFVETVDESLADQNTQGLQLAVPGTLPNRVNIAGKKLEDLEKKKNELGFDGIISGILDVFNYLSKAIADSLNVILGGTAPTGRMISSKNSFANDIFKTKQTKSDLVEKWKGSFTNNALLEANERVRKERDAYFKTEKSFQDLSSELKRFPTAEELAARAGVSIEEAQKNINYRGAALPFDALDLSDFVPGAGLIGMPVRFGEKTIVKVGEKAIIRETTERLIKKYGRDTIAVIERDEIKISLKVGSFAIREDGEIVGKGLSKIIAKHGKDFAKRGIKEEEIDKIIGDVLKDGDVIEKGIKNGKPFWNIEKITARDKIRVTINPEAGEVITAHPV